MKMKIKMKLISNSKYDLHVYLLPQIIKIHNYKQYRVLFFLLALFLSNCIYSYFFHNLYIIVLMCVYVYQPGYWRKKSLFSRIVFTKLYLNICNKRKSTIAVRKRINCSMEILDRGHLFQFAHFFIDFIKIFR